ncbi:MAG: alpha/beta hydrolase [Bryobacteraceae bacterium]
MRLAFLLLIPMLAPMLAPAAQEIVLRPDLPAGEEWYKPEAGNQHVKSDSERWVRKVQRPVLEVYPAASPNGTAVVIAPGGGFNILAIEHEGRDVAKWMNGMGVTAFVLRYRVTMPDRAAGRKAAVEDGLLAVKTVRERAKDWKLDPERIGIVGFSAGGWVAIGAATQYDAASRPDFAAPIYAAPPPGYTVPADAPPLFTAVAYDDRDMMVNGAAQLVMDWKKAKVPAEGHVFVDGGHGFGMNKKGKSCDEWTARLADWMKRGGLLP